MNDFKINSIKIIHSSSTMTTMLSMNDLNIERFEYELFDLDEMS